MPTTRLAAKRWEKHISIHANSVQLQVRATLAEQELAGERAKVVEGEGKESRLRELEAALAQVTGVAGSSGVEEALQVHQIVYDTKLGAVTKSYVSTWT